MSDVTYILGRIEDGDRQASEELLPVVYQELRRLAAQRMSQQQPDHTLQATALVHEAYLRLVDVEKAQKWDSRGHFFGAAAEAMRRILVENARRKQTAKHGGEWTRLTLDEGDLPHDDSHPDLYALDDTLTKLAEIDATAAELVKLRYFAGLTMRQAAHVLDVSERSAYYMWEYARSWLHRELRSA